MAHGTHESKSKNSQCKSSHEYCELAQYVMQSSGFNAHVCVLLNVYECVQNNIDVGLFVASAKIPNPK